METYLLIAAVLLPTLSAICVYLIKNTIVRNIFVGITTAGLFVVAGGFVKLLLSSGGRIEIRFESILSFDPGWIIKFLDLFLLMYIVYVGIRLRKLLITGLAVLQLIPLVLFEVFGSISEPEVAFVIDYLSLIMILLVSIIGPIITIFAVGYMKEHEQHLHLKKSKQPAFFAILFIFLAAMNALVMTNNLLWMYFFWEVTTLCSFLLISHDGNAQSIKNSIRALVLNLLGGVAFITAIIVLYKATGTLSIEEIINSKPAAGVALLLPFGLGLLCFAGFTKAAQFPFQSWLLGAMVAPTPVSALLHSSTMVKAGVYLIVRIAPAFSGSLLGKMVAIVGGFTFLAGSAIAISQSNGKRVLAYSTIANLGLIICCAGIGTHIALGAAIMLIIFHAVSKALLFLCIGTIEHGIGSRDIEDMQGLMKKMPYTTVITVLGMISMLLPPFGVLITKWLAIEASVHQPVVLLLIILGSAFTVVFWAKWIGIILTMSYKTKYVMEKLSITVRSTLAFLMLAVLGCSVAIAPIFNTLIQPQIVGYHISDTSILTGASRGVWLYSPSKLPMGGFAVLPVFIIVFVLMILIPYFLHITKAESIKGPYLCGESTNDIRGIEFIGPGDKVENVIVHNYYLSGIFGENNLTLLANLIAIGIIFIMFGVVIG